LGVAVFFGSFSSAVRRNEQIGFKGAALIKRSLDVARDDKGSVGIQRVGYCLDDNIVSNESDSSLTEGKRTSAPASRRILSGSGPVFTAMV
jgi:hypothetical protein